MRVGQQSITHDVNMYFKIVLLENYYRSVEYEIDDPLVLISTWHVSYYIHEFLNFIVREDVV